MTDHAAPKILRHPLAAPLLLALLTILVHVNSFPGAFIQDDLHIVRNNPLVSSPDLVTIFTSDYWHGYQNTGLYRPLTILSLALNRMVLGAAPWGYHLVNLLLHALTTLLFWALLKRLGMVPGAAFLAAALFAVHPIHVEVVNVVVGRSELLVAVFLLAGCLVAGRPGGAPATATALLYLCALLSKEHAIVFPVLLVLIEGFRDRSLLSEVRRRWPLYVVLVLTALAWLAWRQFALVQSLPRAPLSPDGAPLAAAEPVTRVLTALLLQGLYLFKLICPVDLQVVYASTDLPTFLSSPFSLAGLATLALTLLVAALIGIGWRRRKPLSLWGALYFTSFAVTANLLFPIGVSFAERLAYFPSLWFCAAAGVLLWPGESPGIQRWVRTGIAVIALFVLAGLSLLRNPDYASEVSLWQAEVRQNPDDYLGWQSLAEALANAGQLSEAEQAYQTLTQLAPEFLGGMRSQVIFYVVQKRYREALPWGERALMLSRERGDRYGESIDRLYLARIYAGLHQYEQALDMLTQKGATWPDENAAQELLGRALTGLQRHEEAVTHYARATIFREEATAFYYGLSLLQLGRLDEARRQLEQAVLSEGTAESWNLLGAACANQGDWPVARAAFARAVELAPGNRYYRENLERAIQLENAGLSAGNGE